VSFGFSFLSDNTGTSLGRTLVTVFRGYFLLPLSPSLPFSLLVWCSPCYFPFDLFASRSATAIVFGKEGHRDSGGTTKVMMIDGERARWSCLRRGFGVRSNLKTVRVPKLLKNRGPG